MAKLDSLLNWYLQLCKLFCLLSSQFITYARKLIKKNCRETNASYLFSVAFFCSLNISSYSENKNWFIIGGLSSCFDSHYYDYSEWHAFVPEK